MNSPHKPGHHLVTVDKVREWRTTTNTDRQKSICMYCDESCFSESPNLRCSRSCGTYDVWVNTTTLAKITLELH
jgi:hypothetical protein